MPWAAVLHFSRCGAVFMNTYTQMSGENRHMLIHSFPGANKLWIFARDEYWNSGAKNNYIQDWPHRGILIIQAL